MRLGPATVTFVSCTHDEGHPTPCLTRRASGVNDRIVVSGKGQASNNKSYADLNGVCRENCMVVQRDMNANSSGNETLVFISQDVWDQRVETGGWLQMSLPT